MSSDLKNFAALLKEFEASTERRPGDVLARMDECWSLMKNIDKKRAIAHTSLVIHRMRKDGEGERAGMLVKFARLG